jgi:hypothetical protein
MRPCRATYVQLQRSSPLRDWELGTVCLGESDGPWFLIPFLAFFAMLSECFGQYVFRLWQKDDMVTLSTTMATYTEAVNKFTRCAAAFFDHERLLAEAQIRQKEIEAVRLRKEIAALRLVIPLLIEEMNTNACQIEYSSGDADVTPCGKHAVATQMECDSLWAML